MQVAEENAVAYSIDFAHFATESLLRRVFGDEFQTAGAHY